MSSFRGEPLYCHPGSVRGWRGVEVEVKPGEQANNT